MVTQKPTFLEWLVGGNEYNEWLDYRNKGGAYGILKWKKLGKPSPPTQVAMSKEEALARVSEKQAKAKERKQEEVVTKATQTFEEEKVWERSKWERDFAERQRQFNEQQKIREKESGVKTYAKYGVNPYDIPETPQEEGQWNPYTGQYEAPMGWISPADQTQRDWQKQQMDFEQQKWGEQMAWNKEQAGMEQARVLMEQEERERQYGAQLASQPMSWLQYSSYTGQTPVVQPWMLPLMSGQYNVGQAIPNWQGGGQMGQAQSMSALPELRNPSMQYWGRMGPTAQQQYLGYQQGRTGIRPEESMFRQRATAAPSGRYSGLRWMR